MRLSSLQQYSIVTANYWAFTLTDGALRMLVLFHFHELGYSTLEIAFLFLFYEFFGILTNLYGGLIGARSGLRFTLWVGTLLQILALLMLIPVAASWPKLLSVTYVMVAQAVSGIAKDLNKMSAKSAIKVVVPVRDDDVQTGDLQLFKWVAILTGSKNALKGVGFFLGGLLLTSFGFNVAVGLMAAGLALAFLPTLALPADFGQMKDKPSSVVPLLQIRWDSTSCPWPVFSCLGPEMSGLWWLCPFSLEASLGWSFWEIGGFSGPLGHRLRHRPGGRSCFASSLGEDHSTWGFFPPVLECPVNGDTRPHRDCPLA
jgi:hypothetical protein